MMNRRSVAMPATLAVLLLVWAAGSCEATNGRPFAATSSGAVPAAAGPKAAAAVDECAADGVGDAEQLQRKGPRARAIRFDETEHVELRNGHPKRLTFQIEQPSPLTIHIRPNGPFQLVRKLFYNQSVSILIACSNITHVMTLSCARPGRYDLLLMPHFWEAHRSTATTTATPPAAAIDVQVNRFNRYANWSLLDGMEDTTTSIRHHNRVQRGQMMVKWEKSKLDANAVHYCLVVSTQRNQRSLCAALVGTSPTQWLAALRLDNHSKPFQRHNTADTNAASSTAVPSMAPHVHDNGGPLVICTGRQSRQQLNGMQPNRRYFIDVFGVHTRRDGLTFRMASTSVWFNRSQPQPLADGEVVTTRLAELGRMTVFSYRVAAHAAAAASGANVTLVQVLPCGIGLLVKVFRRKVPLVQQELDRPTVLRVPDTRPGDRLVIKVSTADRYEFRRSQRMGIAVTVASRFRALPEMPNNTSVEQIVANCESTWIAWFSSPDVRTVRYCVTVVRVSSRTYFNEDLSSSNVCEISALAAQPSLTADDPVSGRGGGGGAVQTMHCFESPHPRASVQTYELTDLAAGNLYSVHVHVQVDSVSVPYELLRLNTDPHCYRMESDELEQEAVDETTAGSEEAVSEE